MTAQEAREITNSKKRNTASIMESISAMANSGSDYACIRLDDVLDPKLSETELTEMGYKIKLTENHFNINW